MKNKQDKIIELQNLILELSSERKVIKDKTERINELKTELEELQHSLDSEIYNEDSQPILNL